ncbi:MAG: hypothetical protein COW04_01285 [Deltaproteobacteria bacterium CG12_big_fil_rev_8_21_14_0_65_43_10]|nr:MAG: hypothetical protein AUK23_08070 [Deltaproteobacteria bacterium CG2_30_43_15]PIQ46595.1 MAG: hypothetical protein COW04_01285 [Deltaproteobacteria bacterium CG12_big_fil_rev_8_21_14_0_65_43_10]PIU85895.1 MAG: hypothetical protein COS67_05405 [Deltaproteobacteria bacterium CG06_land_8_20_14_3_00_44_19]PIX22822.1 MAG: hypothetical protein COZ68_11125 [Deltaproteobacteria bacterium CG_4_8_14_3_um_filter_43_13]PIZ18375.1 MAG: hypothetical protein COY50_15660 [Deltaproteobacteria bacterium C
MQKQDRLLELIREGKVEEEDILEDFQRVDYIAATIEEIKKGHKSLNLWCQIQKSKEYPWLRIITAREMNNAQKRRYVERLKRRG